MSFPEQPHHGIYTSLLFQTTWRHRAGSGYRRVFPAAWRRVPLWRTTTIWTVKQSYRWPKTKWSEWSCAASNWKTPSMEIAWITWVCSMELTPISECLSISSADPTSTNSCSTRHRTTWRSDLSAMTRRCIEDSTSNTRPFHCVSLITIFLTNFKYYYIS